jgi:Tfp pilus assembly protein PilX
MIKKLTNQEDGFASIVIAFVLIIVLTLLTIGFGQLARNEQQNSLNDELSSQASDAVSSGINEAYNDMTTKQTDGSGCTFIYETCGSLTTDASSTTCMSPTATNLPSDSESWQNRIIGNPGNDVGITCELVNLTPPDIIYSDLSPGQDQYTTFSVTTVHPDRLGTIKVNWGSADSQSSYPNDPSNGFPTTNSWNSSKYGPVLEVSITPISDLTRSTMIDNTYVAYLYPSLNGTAQYLSSGTYVAGIEQTDSDGPILAGDCSTTASTYPCSTSISGFNTLGTAADGPYLIKVTDFYDAANVDVSFVGEFGGSVTTDNGQAQIDITAKAKDVLKREQVRVPIVPTIPTPAYALEGENICKRLETRPNVTDYNSGESACGFPFNGTNQIP